jgi:precorrin-6Y C5,15-methyltransferase (decarboxylating)
VDELRGDGSVRCVAEYRADEIRRIIETAPEKWIALLVSGDSGFYSGTSGWLKAIGDLPVSVTILPGISSLSALCAKTGISWEDAAVFSLHGKLQNFYSALASGEKLVLLGADGFEDVLEDLVRLGFGSSESWIGQRLGSADEKVLHGTVQSLRGQAQEPLSILMVLPHRAGRRLRRFGIADEEFIRGEVPMTKSEVRAVCMSRLAIGPCDTVYDIGAGTGSISVEASIAAMRGHVFAIERDEKALPLIGENAKKFLCRNLKIVPGEAPEVLRDLPAPDAVMIGGSGGKLTAVIGCVVEKNPEVRIVVTAASLETLQEALRAAEAVDIRAEYTQIAASRIIRRGGYHMMSAQNPVWVISMERDR